MLANFHTHTTFCDGKNTVEEIVQSAIEKGFDAIGFSGHGRDATSSYSIQKTQDYMNEVRRVGEKYRDRIQVYLGIEEEKTSQAKREDFDYIIGSSHKFLVNGKAYDVDSDLEGFRTCLSLFDGDPLRMAETYFSEFTDYILARKPDIVGHFDLLTKFEEVSEPVFFCNEKYHQIAERYLTKALTSGCIFEVNTGAISRGYRTAPYPHERLLHVMKKHDAKVILTSDSHSADTLDCHFTETLALLRDVGFDHLYALYHHEWVKYSI